VLRPLQEIFPSGDRRDLLVGLDHPDDAAVWRISPDRAVVFTADFFTPIVDTPYEFGAIAAANAVSDVYAMGGEPILALNLCAFPSDLPAETVREIIRGGAEKIREAGGLLVGGHSIRDPELKFGMAVVGLANPERLMMKNRARVGDRLFLTKPLGSGVVSTALQRQMAKPQHVKEAVRWMMELNNAFLPLIREVPVSAGTDVTGFGLIGHASEIAQQSGVRIRIRFSSVPFFSGARGYSRLGMISGGTRKNRDYFGARTVVSRILSEADQWLLFDAQTSGGLLLCVANDRMNIFHTLRKKVKHPIWEIGSVVEGDGGSVEIV
jgi:selenide, water dikinase